MLRSIRSTLDRRQQSVGRQANAADVTQQAVLSFLKESYPDFTAQISVRYLETDKVLMINTQNKTLAGELLLFTPELRGHLVAHGIRVERIVVR